MGDITKDITEPASRPASVLIQGQRKFTKKYRIKKFLGRSSDHGPVYHGIAVHKVKELKSSTYKQPLHNLRKTIKISKLKPFKQRLDDGDKVARDTQRLTGKRDLSQTAMSSKPMQSTQLSPANVSPFWSKTFPSYKKHCSDDRRGKVTKKSDHVVQMELDAVKKARVKLMELPVKDLLPALKKTNVISNDQREKMNTMTSEFLPPSSQFHLPQKKFSLPPVSPMHHAHQEQPILHPPSSDGSFKTDTPPEPIDTDIIVSRRKIVKPTHVLKNQEPCSLIDSDVMSQYFTSTGGVMVIEEYGVTVNVPSGAIEDRHRVEIQAAASLFGSFDIPNNYRPVSAYVWIGANYTFKKLIKVEFEHHADISNSADISHLCILGTCYDCHKMYKVTGDYIISDSFCTLCTNHFCSYCLAAKIIKVPDRIVAYHYLPEDYKILDEFRAELCFCYDLNCCKKTIEKRFMERKMIKSLGVPLRLSLTKMDELHLSDPSMVDGWNITHLSSTKMEVSEIDFRQWYTSAEDLAEDENRDHYPPRFLTHLKCHQPNTLDVSYMLHVIKDGKTVKEYSFSVFVKASHEITSTENMEISEKQSPTTTTTSTTTTNTTTTNGNMEITELDRELEEKSKKSPTNTLEALKQEPQMGHLVKFVIPKVKAYWEEIAYVALNYEISDVEAIKQNESDVKKCCQALFKDWLTTEHGVKPKTWSTLLTHLKEVEELSAVVEAIEDKLRQQLFCH